MNRAAFSVSALSFLLLSGGVRPTYAAEPTFAKLQSMCRNKSDAVAQGYCAGFVEAIAARIARDDKGCALLQDYIDRANADLALADLIADINPSEYPKKAIEAVEKFFYNRGCS